MLFAIRPHLPLRVGIYMERDKDKLLTKADALLIFATKEDLARQIGDSKSEIIKWMFIFWVVTIGVLSGIMFTMLHAYLK